MSPTLRKPSPRVTSAATSAGDRLGFADDGTAESEAGRDSAFGAVCCNCAAGRAPVGSRNRADCVAVCPMEGDGVCGLAESCAGSNPAGGNVVCGVRAGRSCATIGGVFKTVGANSAVGPLPIG